MTAVTNDWRVRYTEVAAGLAALVEQSRLTLAGFSACVDWVVRLDSSGIRSLDALAHRSPATVAALGVELLGRMAAGRGGEVVVTWPDGPHWFAEHFAVNPRLGGTGPQVAATLTRLGAPAIIALADRSAQQLAVLDPDIRLVEHGHLVPAAEATPSAGGKPPHVIVEFHAGLPLPGGGRLPRSSRIIVRFADDGLERDEGFAALSNRLVADAGAGIVSGLNGLSATQWKQALDWVDGVVTGWRVAGLDTVHLELAEYPDADLLDAALARLGPRVTSLGLSASELHHVARRGITQGAPIDAAARLAARYGLRRVCVHADDHAFSITRDDPEREQSALLTGSLLAAARAAAGEPARNPMPPSEASYVDFPGTERTLPDGLHAVAVAAPYLERPSGTVGLGDTFLAGTLLALGAPPDDQRSSPTQQGDARNGDDPTRP